MRETFARASLLMALATVLVVVGSSARSDGFSDEGPNVIFVFSDAHRWHAMSSSGMEELKTPNMQRMVDEGVSFDHAISNYPLCSPTRAILMTGRWPLQQKMNDGSPGMIDNDLPLSSDQETLGKAFKDAGFATGYIGKWHLGGKDAEAFGFDTSIVWTNTASHRNSTFHTGGTEHASRRYNATHMTDQAIEFVEANAQHPFFLMLSIDPPHPRLDDAPDAAMALYPESASVSRRANHRESPKRPDAGKQRGYHAHVSAVDAELGRVIARLEALDLQKRTILVYSSDHGAMLRSHGQQGKRWPYDEAIRVPFLVWSPGRVPPTGRVEAPIGTIDVMPSLLGLAGVPVPAPSAGRDLSAFILGKAPAQPGAQLIMHIAARGSASSQLKRVTAPAFRGLRTKRFTLAINVDQPNLLFDNRADPAQLQNLFERPELAETRRQLGAELSEQLRRAGDPFSPSEHGLE